MSSIPEPPELDLPPEPLPSAPADLLDSAAAGSMLLRGGVLRFGSYIVLIGLSVLSAALLTRYLKSGTFSGYTAVISLTTVVAGITDAGMSNIGTREYAILPVERDALMRDLLGLRVVLTLVGVVLATTFAAVAGYGPALVAGTVAAGLGTVALVFQHTLAIPLTVDLRLGVLSGIDIARQAMWVALIGVVILVGAGVLPLLAIPLAVNLVLIVPTAAMVRGRISARLTLRPRRWGPLLRVTVAFSLAAAVGTIYLYAAQIVSNQLLSSHQSDLFALSFRVFIVTVAIPGLLVSAALPILSRAARDDHTRLAYALRRIFETSLIAGVGAALIFIAAAPFIIAVLGGHRYAGAVPVLRIQSLAMIASFLGAGWGFALMSLHYHREMLIVNAASLIVIFVLLFVLAPIDAAQGSAIATVGGESTLAIGLLIALVRRNPAMRPPLPVVGKVLLAGSIAGAIALIPPMPSIVRAIVLATIYGLLILWLRALPEELLGLLPLPRRRQA